MLGIGFQELLLILVLLVVCFRPEQLAELVRTAGSIAGRLRHVGRDLREEVERELSDVTTSKRREERPKPQLSSPPGEEHRP
jgi:Sec-independent protein translocase protein TatA